MLLFSAFELQGSAQRLENGNICDHYRLRTCLLLPTIPEYQHPLMEPSRSGSCWINSHAGKQTEEGA